MCCSCLPPTICCSNISPQVGAGFNRDYWARFEKLVKDVVKHADGVYVVTGPLFLPQPDGETNKWTMKHPMIGDEGTLA
jgi:endonuclease G